MLHRRQAASFQIISRIYRRQRRKKNHSTSRHQRPQKNGQKSSTPSKICKHKQTFALGRGHFRSRGCVSLILWMSVPSPGSYANQCGVGRTITLESRAEDMRSHKQQTSRRLPNRWGLSQHGESKFCNKTFLHGAITPMRTGIAESTPHSCP